MFREPNLDWLLRELKLGVMFKVGTKHSMKRLLRFLWIVLATFAALASLQAQDFVNATNQPLKPVRELHVVLEKAYYVSTERLSAEYEFAIKDNSLTNGPTPFSIHLYQGSDIDDQGRDSIERLNTFFGSARTNAADAGRMAIQNTNIVTALVFKSGWLFRDERGRTTAITESMSPKWQSKGIFEQFSDSKTNLTSSAGGSRR